MPTYFAMGDPHSILHDLPLTPAVSVLDNDWTSTSNPKSVTAVNDNASAVGQTITLASGSSLTMQATGFFVFTPVSHTAYTEFITYTGTDGESSADATITIEVTNNAPFAWGNPMPMEVSHHGETEPIDLAQFAGDGDNDPLQLIIVSQATHGEFTLIEGTLYRYVPNPTYTGQDSIGFQASDGVVDSNSATFTFNVTNSAPSAGSDSYQIAHDLTMDTRGSLRDSVLANDTDADGDEITAAIVSGPTHGTVWLDPDGFFVYTPNDHYVGFDHFTYEASDGNSTSSPTSVTIEITNAAPTELTLSNTTIKIYDTQVGTLAAVDPDYLETFTYTLVNTVSYPDNELFTIEDDQLQSASADLIEPGEYTIQVQATDALGSYVAQTFTITVENVAVWIDSVQDAVEGETTGYFRLRRSDSSGELTAAYTIDAERTTVTAGVDYAALTGSVTFAIGQQTADIVVDPTGNYANPNNPNPKRLGIQLVPVPGGVGVAAAAVDALAIQPDTRLNGAPVFSQQTYQFILGQVAWRETVVGTVSAAVPNFAHNFSAVRYRITSGNDEGSYSIDPTTGTISVVRSVPAWAPASTTLTVEAYIDRIGINPTAETTVVITLQPTIVVTGDFQGVAAPVGSDAMRDRIRLEFFRIGSTVGALTANFTVAWPQGFDASAALESTAALLNVGPGEGSVTFADGQRSVYIAFTVKADYHTGGVSGLSVQLSPSQNYVVPGLNGSRYLGRLKPGHYGYRNVEVKIYDATRLYASANDDNARVDRDQFGEIDPYGINFNDAIQDTNRSHCWFMASIGALAQRNPAFLQSMLWQDGDGTISVQFYNLQGQALPHRTYVTKTLDQGTAAPGMSGDHVAFSGAGTREYEIWPILLQKAYAKEFGWENFAGGNSVWQVWRRMTGGNASWIELGAQTPADIGQILATADQLGKKIAFSSAPKIAGDNQEIPVQVGNQTYNIFRGHVYLAWRVSLGVVNLYDPARIETGVFMLSVRVEDIGAAGLRLTIL